MASLTVPAAAALLATAPSPPTPNRIRRSETYLAAGKPDTETLLFDRVTVAR